MRRLVIAALATLAMLAALAPDALGITLRFPNTTRGVFALGATGGFSQPTGQLARDVNLATDIGNSGLALQPGFNYGIALDYFLTNHWAIGLWGGSGWLHMKDLRADVGNGPVTFKDMVRGQTTPIGGYVKAYASTRGGAWTPCAYAGVTSFHRKAQVSRDATQLFPSMTVFEMSDTKLGFSGGVGVEYQVAPALTMNAMGATHVSGKFAHTFQWSGSQTVVKNWNFNTFDVALAYHFGAER